jgi:diketogulonate reductase-like aldo/keto reductase
MNFCRQPKRGSDFNIKIIRFYECKRNYHRAKSMAKADDRKRGTDLKRLGKTGRSVPSIGMGTWGIGGFSYKYIGKDKEAIDVLQQGIELGMWLIDTAELYGRGHSEELVGEAIKVFPRESVYVVTKVLDRNLGYSDLIEACRRSLWRLQTDYIDLYLIHFPNYRVPLSETMRAMEDLFRAGSIKSIGVSNFPLDLVQEAQSYLSEARIEVNEVKYNVKSRYPELDLLPFCQKEEITLIAYTPLEEGSLTKNSMLRNISRKYQKSAAQVALNWLIYHDNVITIPKASKLSHLKENAQAMGWRLKQEDFNEISRAFPVQ